MHIKKNPDTSFTPGAVFKICNAGRSVSAVAWHAPATIPSASFAFTIITPNVNGSLNKMSLAFSKVIPLFLRVSYNKFTYSSSLSQCRGFTILTPSRSISSHVAPSIIFSGSPIIIILAIPSWIICDAAISVLLSVVSGKTMVLRSILALSLITSMYDISCLLLSKASIQNNSLFGSFRQDFFAKILCNFVYNLRLFL